MENNNHPITSFINSRFGLFLLSAIFLSIVPFLYNFQKENRKKTLEAEKLRIEITHRLDFILKLGKKNIRPWEIDNIYLASFGSDIPINPKKHSFKSLFQDYKQRTVVGLISEYGILSKSFKENISLTNAIQQVVPTIDCLLIGNSIKKRIDLPNNKWTVEYTLNKSQSILFNEKIKVPIKHWVKTK